MLQQCYNSANSVSKFKKVTHVIMDMDGTLIDSENIYFEAIDEIAKEYGKKHTVEIANKLTGTPERVTCDIAIKELGLSITTDEFLIKFRAITDKKIENVKLMPGAETIIKHFHDNKIPMAIATSAPQDSFQLKMKHHQDLFQVFNHVVCGNDPELKKGKPAPDIYLLCASRFPDKPKPEMCLVFEDAVIGMKSALSAGMQIVLIPSHEVPYESCKLATITLNGFNDVEPELFGLPPFPQKQET